MATLNEKILAFARNKKGRKVGRGECWDLAETALKKAGGKTSHDYGKVTQSADYKWGKEITLGEARAGDIVQYKNFAWRIDITHKDGSTSWREMKYPHHTAILESKKGHGMWKVLEQNINGRLVKEHKVYLKNQHYTDEDGDQIKITVKGKRWIYRPQPRPRRRR
ncbi:MAG: hypothetical protein D6730_22525 [Bacteroidetes bacterium]|nr:MAG: hypothetical protein D6730_22525 [Bacteroidota bacterium]